jgi:hypothetical protein
VRELARWCGYLPLAIRAAAARLVARPHLSVEQVTGEIAAVRQSPRVFEITTQEGIVTAVMQSSYDHLDPGTGTATDLIEWLAAASLLEETEPGRWQFHNLTRAHARDTAAAVDSDDERAAATGRVIEYYLRASAAADLLILPGRLRIAAAFSLPVRCPRLPGSRRGAGLGRRRAAQPARRPGNRRCPAAAPGRLAIRRHPLGLVQPPPRLPGMASFVRKGRRVRAGLRGCTR